MTQAKHTFVICAYKESAYLHDCIQSLLRQTLPSTILCATSTPNRHIQSICDRHGIPLRINPEQGGIATDWNFAYAQAETPLVTLAHQDDVYEPDFLKHTLDYLCKSKHPLISFTDYYELRGGVRIDGNTLLRVKRIMCLPWLFRPFWGFRFMRNRIFSFGNPVCCPSVTMVKPSLPFPLFNTHFRNNCDYLAWVETARLPGDFVYIPKRLTAHRVHADSATTQNIGDNSRSEEDLAVLRMFWPMPIAKMIFRLYKRGQKSNEVN